MMNDFIQERMVREDQYHLTQKSIVDYVKYSVKNKNPLQPEYSFLQDNPNGTQKELTVKQLATFLRDVTNIMIPYYQNKQVNDGFKEFFSMYQQLGASQQKEKAMLAFNFYFTRPNSKDYPFSYFILNERFGNRCACGEKLGHFQGGATVNAALTEQNANMLEARFVNDFFHFYPLGKPEKDDVNKPTIARRIYINTTPENATAIATELFRKCATHPDDKNYKPYIKFNTKDDRNDIMLAYCTEKNFEIMLGLVHEIYHEHKEWFNGTGRLPLMSKIYGANDHLIVGIADEPSERGTSFNSIFCDDIISTFRSDLRGKVGKDLTSLSMDEIDHYVTYENLKPYIDKTCYSADYPFLTKETVKNKQLEAGRIL